MSEDVLMDAAVDVEGLGLSEAALRVIEERGPMTALDVYRACELFEDSAHAARILAMLATRDPRALVRREVENRNREQGARRTVFEYDLAARDFSGEAVSMPRVFKDLFAEGSTASEGGASGAPQGPAGGDPNNTGSAEGEALLIPPDPAVGAGDAVGATEGASTAGHEIQVSAALAAARADIDALSAERDGLLRVLGVDNVIEAEPAVRRLREALHAASNDAAAFRMVLEGMRGRLEVPTLEAVPAAFEAYMAEVEADLQTMDRLTTHPLFEVFAAVVDQVTQGKGRRHGGDETPFLWQPWVSIANAAGNGFLVGQGIKKAMESGGKGDFSSWETEVLGAVAYLSMAVLHGRRFRPDVLTSGQDDSLARRQTEVAP
jgi:hypothetical protein